MTLKIYMWTMNAKETTGSTSGFQSSTRIQRPGALSYFSATNVALAWKMPLLWVVALLPPGAALPWLVSFSLDRKAFMIVVFNINI